MRREYLAYGAVFLFFAGVVLWATEAPWQAVAVVGGAAVVLLAMSALARPAPVVLVVGERADERLDSLHRAFEDAGFDLEVCPGPENSACPAVHGRPCPAHDHVVAAVVVRHPDEAGALPPCGEALHVPEIAVEEHSDRQIEVDGRYARVGLERGPEAVLDALDRVSAA
jgi:hypothetical protein